MGEEHKADSIAQILDALIAKQLIQSACIDILLHLIGASKGLLQDGVATVDNLPLKVYFDQEKAIRIEEILIGMEDKNPGVAAYLQRAVDQYRANSGE